MKEPNSLEELFNDAFEGFSVLPDNAIKSAIDEELFNKKRKRKFGFWIFFVGAMIGLMAIAAGMFYAPNSIQTAKVENSVQNQQLLNQEFSDVKTLRLEDVSTNDKPKTEVSKKAALVRPVKQRNNVEYLPNNNKANNAAMNTKSPTLDENIRQQDTKSLSSKQAKQQWILSPLNIKKNILLKERANQLEARIGSIDSVRPKTEELKPKMKVQQSITAFMNYGFESTTSKNTQQNHENFETANIRINTIEAKLEYKRAFSKSFAFNLGIGYANHSILQRGSLTAWDSIPNGGIVINAPDPTAYIPSYYSSNLNYRLQQIHLGIGLSYTRLIHRNWNLDLSAGTNLSLGQLKQTSGSSMFESPKFSAFGMSLYFRPAIEYSFGNYSILAFGQVNQTLLSHIRWSFLANRNPSFGGGIAFRYNF